jgi:SAM-dependent methyltransferase
MKLNPQDKWYWRASICFVFLGFLVLLTTKPDDVPRFDLDNPWSDDVLERDQLRLSAVRGTHPNPIAASSIKSFLQPLNIQSGDVVADIGCGSGYTLPTLIDSVGPQGMIYAVEFPDSSIKYLQERIKNQKMTNVIVHQDIENNLLLPKNTLDKAFLINVMHAFRTNDPNRLSRNGIDFVRSIFSATKPGGRIMVIDYERIEQPIANDNPQNVDHVLSRTLLRKVFTENGFQDVQSQVLSPRGLLYSIIFEKPKLGADDEL